MAATVGQLPMTHVLAEDTLHIGGGIFSLVVSLFVVPAGLAMLLYPHETAEEDHWRGGGPMSPLATRITGLFFLVIGVSLIILDIHKFTQGGY